MRAPVSIKAWSPLLQSRPTTAPFITCAKDRMRVPAPTPSRSRSARDGRK
jgi:hypothetical protein